MSRKITDDKTCRFRILLSLIIFYSVMVLFLFSNNAISDDDGNPDLFLSTTDITFSNHYPNTGEKITIYALVHNSGEREGAAQIEFWDTKSSDSEDIPELIGKTSITVKSYKSKIAPMNWTSQSGSHIIFVRIVGTHPEEQNEENNFASRKLTSDTGEKTPLLVQGGVATLEEDTQRTIPIKVTNVGNVSMDVSLLILDDADFNITLVLQELVVMPEETVNFYATIVAPKLGDNGSLQQGKIFFRAIADDVFSNTAELTIMVHPSVKDSSWWSPATVATTATIGVFGAIYLLFTSTELGKYKFLGIFIVPLYTRINKDNVLKHETRGLIKGYIIANPGDSFNSIKRALDLSNGTLAYHLRVLEREQIVISKRDGIYKRFYPTQMKISKHAKQLSSIQKQIINIIKKNPGISQTGIAKELDTSVQVVNYHVKILEEVGFIEINMKEKHTTQCFITNKIVPKLLPPPPKHYSSKSYLP